MPWLLWGHDVARRREEDDASSITGAELVVPEKPIPHKETPDSIGQQFFDTVVIPSDGRVPGSKMYTAYVR